MREPRDTRTETTGENRRESGRYATSRRDLLMAAGVGAGALAAGVGAGTASVAGQSVDERGIHTPWLSVEGNRVVDPDGNEVILRGVNIPDPKRLAHTVSARGKDAEHLIDLATDPERGWHSRVVRLPVHPGDIAELPPVPVADVDVHRPPTFRRAELEEYLETYLDPAVALCAELNVYCIVDYHRHWGDGDLEWTDDALDEEVRMFWDTVAPRYADRSHVLFEVYNEPTLPAMYIDDWYTPKYAGLWRMWKQTAQPWVDIIREHAPENLVIVGNPGWSAMPEGAQIEEFDGGNLMYAYHIYGGHGLESDVGFDGRETEEGTNGVWADVPLFMTEFGWEPNAGRWISGETDGFGRAVAEWADERPIHWTAWCFDATWLPRMFSRSFVDEDSVDAVGDPYSDDIPELCPDPPCEWDLLGRDVGEFEQYSGEYVRRWLERRAAADVPQVPADDQPPAAPSGLTASQVDDHAARLTWEAVAGTDVGPSGLSHYTVFVDGRERLETTDTEATVDRLYAGRSQEITVTATDRNGTVSEPGATEVTLESIAAADPPASPAGLTLAARTHTSVTLEWEEPTATGAAPILEYVCTLEGVEYARVPADEPTLTIDGLEPGTDAAVSLVAVDGAGTESAPVEATVSPRPAEPVGDDVLIDDFAGEEPLVENALGDWTGGGLIDHVEDGVAVVDWDSITYYGTKIDVDATDTPELTFYARGASGFELSMLSLQVGGVEDVPVGDVTDDRLGTDWRVVTIDLRDVGADLTALGQLQLDAVWGTEGRFDLERLWLAGEDDPADGLVIEEPGTGPDPGEGEDALVLGEYEPQPVGGDGLYRDVDGSGSTGANDVVAFFEHLEGEPVQTHPEHFDFNGSGSVGFEDVVALFRQL